jgi:acyl carrier protein
MKDLLNSLLFYISQVDVEGLPKYTRLKEDLNLDSIHLMQIRLEIEKEFDIYIEDEELLKLKTIQDLYSVVESYLNKKL